MSPRIVKRLLAVIVPSIAITVCGVAIWSKVANLKAQDSLIRRDNVIKNYMKLTLPPSALEVRTSTKALFTLCSACSFTMLTREVNEFLEANSRLPKPSAFVLDGDHNQRIRAFGRDITWWDLPISNMVRCAGQSGETPLDAKHSLLWSFDIGLVDDGTTTRVYIYYVEEKFSKS